MQDSFVLVVLGDDLVPFPQCCELRAAFEQGIAIDGRPCSRSGVGVGRPQVGGKSAREFVVIFGEVAVATVRVGEPTEADAALSPVYFVRSPVSATAPGVCASVSPIAETISAGVSASRSKIRIKPGPMWSSCAACDGATKPASLKR